MFQSVWFSTLVFVKVSVHNSVIIIIIVIVIIIIIIIVLIINKK